MKFCLKYIHLGLFYVSDYSGSFDINIESPEKKVFAVQAHGVQAQNFTDWSATNIFIFD